MLDVPVILLLVTWITAALFTVRSWDNFMNLKNLLLLSIVYLFGFLVRNARAGRKLAMVLLFSGMASSIYGIVMYLFNRGWVKLMRTSGSFSTAMTYGGVLFLLSSLFLSLSIGSKISKKIRIAALIATLFGCVALAFTFTRSSWIGLLTSSVVIITLTNRKLLAPFAVAIVVLFLLLPDSYQQRVTSIWDPHFRTNVYRLEAIDAGWRIFKDNPVVGVGSIDMQEIYLQYKRPEAKYIHGHMHNTVLQVAVSVGLVGLIPFCFLFVSFYRLIIGNMRAKLPPLERAWVIGSLGALTGFVVNGLFEWNFGDAEVVMLLYFIIGSNLAIALHKDGFEQEAIHTSMQMS